MKAVDGWIALAGLAALGLAALVVYRAREDAAPARAPVMPSVRAPAPPDADFPACLAQPAGLPRWRCQVRQARARGRLRCYGQRLFYVTHDPSGTIRYAPWPPALQCWTGPASGSS